MKIKEAYCKLCGKKFTKLRYWQTYCSNKCFEKDVDNNGIECASTDKYRLVLYLCKYCGQFLVHRHIKEFGEDGDICRDCYENRHERSIKQCVIDL